MLDNIFIRALARLCDLIILNILWVVCSLPVVTAGTSTAALYAVTLKMVANEEGYIVRGFFQAWKENFKQSMAVWIILMVVGSVLVMDFFIVCRMKESVFWIMQLFVFAAAFIYGIELLFIFPLIARFENHTVSMLKNALLIPIARLPYAAGVIVMTVFCVVVTFLNAKTIMLGAVIWSLIGVACVAFANSFLLRKMFEPYEKQYMMQE